MDEICVREAFEGSRENPGILEGLPTVEMLEKEAREVSRAMSCLRWELFQRLDPEGRLWPLPPPAGEAEERENQEGQKAGRAGRAGFSPFFYYPFLFVSAFPDVGTERLRSLARANRFLLEALLLLDSRMDTDRPVDPLDLYVLDAHYHRALEILVPLLPPESEFWPQCRDLYVQYGRSVLRELVFHRFRLGSYPKEEFRSISAGKAALLQTTVLALCTWTGRREARHVLAASQEAFLCGFQAIDDLKDWREDYARQNYTYLLTGVLRRGGWVRDVERGCPPPVEDVGRALHFHGSAQEQLELAESFFEEAAHGVDSIDVPLWKEMLRAYLVGIRAMKADMAEIRRRERARAARVSASSSGNGSAGIADVEAIERSVRHGIRFLADRQHPGGAFSLACSSNGYLKPSAILGPSQAATELVRRSLVVLGRRMPEALALQRSASRWLECAAVPGGGHLPDLLERAFGQGPAGDWSRVVRAFLNSGRLESVEFPLPEEALAAELLYRAAIGRIVAPGLGLSLLQSAVRAHVDGGTTFRKPEQLGAANGVLRPLLVSYLFCRAWIALDGPSRGPALEALGDRILSAEPERALRTHLTDIALTLACAEMARRSTERLVPLAERLVLGQEGDGSWPPNGFYVEGDRWYGSRDVTTAWCSEALFLHLEARRTGRGHFVPVKSSPQRTAPPTIELHPDVSPEILPRLKKEAARCALWLPISEGMRVYVGTWESMGSRFVMFRDGEAVLGVQIAQDGRLGCSTAGRPLEAELALGWIEAAWMQSGRATGTWKERLFVGGLGMTLCRSLWPAQPPWLQAGLSVLEWRWCRENEWFLREWAKRLWFLPATKAEIGGKPGEAVRAARMELTEKTFLYLGLRIFEAECKEGMTPRDLRSLLGERGTEIDRRIGSLWGEGRMERTAGMRKRNR